MQNKLEKWKWGALVGALLVLILVPFCIWGRGIESWTASFLLTAREHRWTAALVLGGVLAGDTLLPVPSSVVSTGCGVLLGVSLGTLVSLLGMTVSCVIGFGLGRWVGGAWVAKWVGAGPMSQFEALGRRGGDWVLIVTRPIPVLAEASVLMAGVGHLSWGRFLLLTTLSNLGISFVYAWIGAVSADLHSFLLAVGGAVLLPWIGMRWTGQPVCSRARAREGGGGKP